MLRAQALLTATLLTLAGCARAASGEGSFSGESAMAFTRKSVEFGPRPSGSPANAALQAYLLEQLKGCQCEVIEDAFTATTPMGEVPMRNIIARFKGSSGMAIAVSGHFDSKPLPGRSFVGANDGGSSTGVLLELVRVLTGQPRKDDVYVIFFDGEEAFGEWSDTDKLYGSRHLAYRWYQEGLLNKFKTLINVDMIGDRTLNIERDPNSSSAMNDLIWRVAADLGYGRHFLASELAMDDDHMPFALLGVPAVDLIDFDYPHWHEDSDTLDKLSAESLQVVGRVVDETIHRLEQ